MLMKKEKKIRDIKDSKMVLDVVLFNTHFYKLRIKGKRKQPRDGIRALSYTSVL